MISLSSDGYVRLTFRELIELPMRNIYNETCNDTLEDLRKQGVPASQVCVSEWSSDTTPTISLGFTVFVDARDESGARLHLAPEPVRGNVMLVDALGYDMQAETETMLRLWTELSTCRDQIAQHLRREH